MLEFKTEKITDRVTRIYAFATELMYLVEGDNRAVLLDTGSGVGSLKRCVEQLTDKPVTVLITHGHVDHAMGAFEFDDVYMSHKDDYIYTEHSDMQFRKEGIIKLSDDFIPAQEDLIPSAPLSHFKNLKGGDIFNLGGITIEVYDCPGHTKGSVVMLIKEERSLLLGDACNYFTFLFDDYSLSVTEYENSLKKLLSEISGNYDTVYLSHGDGQGHKEIIEDVISVCEDIRQGRTDDVPYDFMGIQGTIAKAQDEQGNRIDGGKGNIVYNKNKI